MLVGSPGALTRYLLLFAALYSAFGVNSPFFPAFLTAEGLDPTSVGVVLALGTTIRLASAPLAGRLADAYHAPRAALAFSIVATSFVTLAYLPASGFWPLLLISAVCAIWLGPLAPLADTLALAAAEQRGNNGRPAFAYGWVRGAGSAAFIAGSIASGQAVEHFGLKVIVVLQAGLLALSALFALAVPHERSQAREAATLSMRTTTGALRRLLSIPLYRRVVLVAALVFGSHAMHDSFAVIRWREAGISPQLTSLLWSEAVAAEVIVFFLIGRPLLERFGTGPCAALCAAAGLLRWLVMAQTPWLPALALVQPLHGLTFALLHLVCMRILAEIVPDGLAATALTIYATLGAGISGVLLTLAAGPLYAAFGATGFLAMAALCAIALPLALTLRSPEHVMPGRPVGP